MKFLFRSELWLYPGDGAWVFVTIPLEVSDEIKALTNGLPRKGFGSIKVIVKIKELEWRTSIFPDKKSKSYLLPIKKEVRRKTNLSPGDTAEFSIKLGEAI